MKVKSKCSARISSFMLRDSFAVALILVSACLSSGQIPGCTDPVALNYNPLAQASDGSCIYEPVSVSAAESYELDAKIVESSGLIHWKGLIWTHNDSEDTRLYGLDPSDGGIRQMVELKQVKNRDWEEISHDSNHIYLGDFGNNMGNRRDLHILRIEKNSLFSPEPGIDTIWFSYADQDFFDPPGGQQTDFDCEAFVIASDSIYLFSKRWISPGTAVYSLPKVPGRYVAKFHGSFNTEGLVTGAVYMENYRLLALCGYNPYLEPFLHLSYDFRNHDFFSGNNRRVRISMPFHQIEGITTENGLEYYITNEKKSTGSQFIKFPQKLHLLDLSELLGGYLVTHTDFVPD